MGKGSPSAPAAPDPAATAAAQASANIDAARAQASLNRVNQYTPFGSVTYQNVGADEVQRRLDDLYAQHQRGEYNANYGMDAYGKQIKETFIPERERERIMREMGGTADRWESRVTLDPRLEGVINSLYGTLNTPLDFSGLPGYSDAATNRQAAADALYGRVQPQMQSTRDALDTRLRNQGLTPGSEAWNNSWREYSMQDNDMRLAIDAQAGAEMNTVFNTENARRQQMLQELLAQRQIPMNEVLALMGGTQIQGAGAGGVQVAPADYTSAVGMNQAAQNTAYQGKVAAQQGNNAAAAAGVGAAASIAAAAIIA